MDKIRTTPVTFGGPTSKGSPYYTFKSDIKTQFKGKRFIGGGDISINILVFIHKNRVGPDRNDLDNFLKPIIDALEEEKYFGEHQISSIHIERRLVETEEEEGVNIEVKEF